jgi:hypothetical protein
MSTHTSGRTGEAELIAPPRASGQGSPPARCTAVRNAIHRGWLITEETE